MIKLLVSPLFLLGCLGTQEGSAPASPAEAAQEPNALQAAIDSAVEAGMQAEHLPGVAVVIVQEGRTIVKRGYGFADLESGRRVDPDRTLFRIGSVSKALTALAVTRLKDRGRLSFDDDVSQYCDGILNLGGFEQAVTVGNLLTHTAGFDQIGGRDRQIRNFDAPLEERKAARPSLADYLSSGKLRRVTPPGLLFRYDTYGITLAGLVLERVTELPYGQAMQQEMFAPLGMLNSFVEIPDERFGELAVGYGWVDGDYVAQPYEVYVTTPASSIDATPADMGRLLEALTNGGSNATGRLLGEAMSAAVLAPQFRPHPRFAGITHGFWESTSEGPPEGPALHSVGHGGTNWGFTTSFQIFTESKIGILVVANRDPEAGGGWVELGSRVAEVVIEHLIDSPPQAQWLPASPDREVDLDQYLGSYHPGIYCRSCTEEEFAQGAWPRREGRAVTRVEQGLQLEEATYLPTAVDDVFVRSDGQQELFFGRDASGQVAFLVYSDGPFTFERVP